MVVKTPELAEPVTPVEIGEEIDETPELAGPVTTVVIGEGIDETTVVNVPPGPRVVKVTPPDVIVTGTLGEVIVRTSEETPPGMKFVIVVPLGGTNKVVTTAEPRLVLVTSTVDPGIVVRNVDPPTVTVAGLGGTIRVAITTEGLP